MNCAVINPGLFMSADEILNMAVMTKVPVMIVEGPDDIPIYERIVQSEDLEFDVYASQTILTQRPGCDGVIEHVKLIREVCPDMDIEKYIVGVVDRDARVYRNEVPEDPAIFVLDFYSIESYFLNRDTVKGLILKVTRATNKLVRDEDCNNLFERIKQQLFSFYYVGLEALRKAIDPNYNACLGYSWSSKSIRRRGLDQELNNKSASLDLFADSLGVSDSWADLLRICKGKWLLEYFSELLYYEIKGLPDMCDAGEVQKCQCCASGSNANCLYGNAAFFSDDLLYEGAFGFVESDSFQRIRNRFKEMVVH